MDFDHQPICATESHHKARDFAVRQRIQVANAIRAHLGEFRADTPTKTYNVDSLLEAVRDVPPSAHPGLELLTASCATHGLKLKRNRPEQLPVLWTAG